MYLCVFVRARACLLFSVKYVSKALSDLERWKLYHTLNNGCLPFMYIHRAVMFLIYCR